MGPKLLVLLALLLPAVPMFGQGLQMLLSPATETSTPTGSVIFSGTLVDTDTDDSFLFLNDISVVFTPPADSYLSVDPTGDPTSSPNTFFFNTVSGDLIGDGVTGDDTYTGPIFEVYIAPDTPLGDYFGTTNILGGYDGPDADFNPLLPTAASFEVVVTPEPGVFLLTLAGLAGLAIMKRRWA
jgi:hypothetical protein